MFARSLSKWFLLASISFVLVCTSATIADKATEAAGTTELEETTRVEEIFGAEPETQPHHHIEGDLLDWFHNPAPGLSMTLDTRLRYVYGWNVNMQDNNSGHLDYGRYRFRWGQKLDLDENTAINSRLTWEFRTWDEPESKPQSTDFDEILFDRLNIELKNPFDLPATATIGRQDLIYGTGWLILDGTPLDGSRTIFFDALKLSWDLDCDTTVDTIYVRQEADASAWLKPINDRKRALTEQDEHAAILYVTNNSLENTQLEGYFIYKNDNPVDFVPASISKKAEIYTLGGAIQTKIDDCWSYRIEGAIQNGDKDGRDLKAFGTKNRLSYHFNDPHNNQLHLDYEYLSGDKNSTDSRDEQFDPLWGEWPQWSELYIYSYSSETAIAETTNLHRVALSHYFNPCKNVQFKTAYHLLWADQTNTSGGIFNEGHNFRGQLATAWLTYSCCKQVKAHIVGEYFMPGNYYADSNRGHATFIRANLEYTF